MQKKTNLELSRKLFHIFFGITYILFYLLLPFHIFVIITALFGVITLMSMYIANTNKNSIFKNTARNSSPLKGIGSLLYLLGLIVVVILEQQGFISKEIVVYAFITLAVGDGLATPIGKASGSFMKSKLFSKSYLGYLGGIVGSLLVSFIILRIFNIPLILINMISLVIVGMTIELILGHRWIKKYAHIYALDNICIPLGIVIVAIAL